MEKKKKKLYHRSKGEILYKDFIIVIYNEILSVLKIFTSERNLTNIIVFRSYNSYHLKILWQNAKKMKYRSVFVIIMS